MCVIVNMVNNTRVGKWYSNAINTKSIGQLYLNSHTPCGRSKKYPTQGECEFQVDKLF